MSQFEIAVEMGEAAVRKIGIVNPILSRLRLSRVEAVQVEGALAKSHIAWKIATLHQALLYRVVMLGDGCASNWNAGNYLCSVLSARSLFETVAVLHDFTDRLRRLLAIEDLASIDALAMNRTFASRNGDLLEKYPQHGAVSVLTIISKLEKCFEGTGFPVRGQYDEICQRKENALVNWDDSARISFIIR